MLGPLGLTLRDHSKILIKQDMNVGRKEMDGGGDGNGNGDGGVRPVPASAPLMVSFNNHTPTHTRSRNLVASNWNTFISQRHHRHQYSDHRQLTIKKQNFSLVA